MIYKKDMIDINMLRYIYSKYICNCYIINKRYI